MLLITLGFSLIRPRNSVVYAPKLKYADEKHAPPRIGKGLFDWIKPLLKLREPDLVEKIGLDAVVFLRFTRMCRNIFICSTVFSVIILIANAVGSNKSLASPSTSSQSFNQQTSGEDKFFVMMTPQVVFKHAVFWVHVVGAYCVNAVVAFSYGGITRQLLDFAAPILQVRAT